MKRLIFIIGSLPILCFASEFDDKLLADHIIKKWTSCRHEMDESMCMNLFYFHHGRSVAYMEIYEDILCTKRQDDVDQMIMK